MGSQLHELICFKLNQKSAFTAWYPVPAFNHSGHERANDSCGILKKKLSCNNHTGSKVMSIATKRKQTAVRGLKFDAAKVYIYTKKLSIHAGSSAIVCSIAATLWSRKIIILIIIVLLNMQAKPLRSAIFLVQDHVTFCFIKGRKVSLFMARTTKNT